jgi:hypothetical protein
VQETAPSAQDVVRELLAPVDLETFVSEHLERGFLHVQGNDLGYFVGFYSLADLERSIVLAAGNGALFRVMRNDGTLVDSREYQRNREIPMQRPRTEIDRVCSALRAAWGAEIAASRDGRKRGRIGLTTRDR